jgi:hypothetical protein
MRHGLLVLMLLPVVAGCVGIGPTTAENWQELVVNAVPPEDGKVLFSSASEWFPDQQGFQSERSGGLGGTQQFSVGVFALTDMSLLFLQWDPPEKKYNVMYRVSYAEVRNFRVDSFGRNRRLVVTATDYRVQSFGIHGPTGTAVDNQATAKATAILESKVTPPRKPS